MLNKFLCWLGLHKWKKSGMYSRKCVRKDCKANQYRQTRTVTVDEWIDI